MSDEKWLAEVSWAGANVFLGNDLTGHSVIYDSAEGVKKGIGPMRALLTSLGACSGMDVVAILKKRKQKLTSLKVLVSGERPEFGASKPWTSVHLKYIISGDPMKREFVEEAVSDSMDKFCSVAATLAPRVKITHSFELLD